MQDKEGKKALSGCGKKRTPVVHCGHGAVAQRENREVGVSSPASWEVEDRSLHKGHRAMPTFGAWFRI